jgi:protease-4
MKFLGNVVATIVGLFVFCMLFFFGFVIIMAIAGDSEDVVEVQEGTVIELDLSNVSLDYAGKINYKDFNYFEVEHNGLTDILNAIEAAKTDDKIAGISILNDESSLGLAQMKAVRNKLEEFKKSGKFVYSYANYYSQSAYYLNSVAQLIYLNPIGELELKGLSSEVLFLKNFQDKSGVKFEILRHGKYKSAVEPFLNQEMSPENREQMEVLLESIWKTMVTDISRSRNIARPKIDDIVASLSARTPELALANKFIDKIAYEDEYHSMINAKLKIKKDEKYHKISIEDYAKNVATSPLILDNKDVIAVIYAQGDIMSGEGDVNVIGEGAIKRSLEEARTNENVKAIVLRVNSPGGNALTSELIWREIEITKKSKPVVVSMGNYAASGGYYIACNANRIFAEPNTITGSIGVFGMLPNISKLSQDLGINAEQVQTHKNALGYSIFEPINEDFKGYALEGIETVYTTFLKRVATGRKLQIAQVDAIAQGRVWTGIDAQKIGLVDEIGGLDVAIKYAAKLGKTTKYKTENFPEYEKNFDDFLSNVTGIALFSTKEQLLKEQLGEEAYQILEQLKKVKSRSGIQALMPYELVIK